VQVNFAFGQVARERETRATLRIRPLKTAARCGCVRFSLEKDAMLGLAMEVLQALVEVVLARHADEKHPERVRHRQPIVCFPWVPRGQFGNQSATAEFWHDPKQRHVEIAHHDLDIELLDLIRQPLPEDWQLAGPPVVREVLVHVNDQDVLRLAHVADAIGQANLGDETSAVCIVPATFAATAAFVVPFASSLEVEELEVIAAPIADTNQHAVFLIAPQGHVLVGLPR
jgi:hypothetical protein